MRMNLAGFFAAFIVVGTMFAGAGILLWIVILRLLYVMGWLS